MKKISVAKIEGRNWLDKPTEDISEEMCLERCKKEDRKITACEYDLKKAYCASHNKVELKKGDGAKNMKCWLCN